MSTPQLTTDDLLRMPWGIRGPSACYADPDSKTPDWWEIRVEELPEFFVADETREGVLDEYLPALTAFLDSYTLHGEIPPVSPAVLWGWLAAMVRPATTATTGSAIRG